MHIFMMGNSLVDDSAILGKSKVDIINTSMRSCNIYFFVSVTFRIIAITQDMLPVKRGSITIYIRVKKFNKEPLMLDRVPKSKLLQI